MSPRHELIGLRRSEDALEMMFRPEGPRRLLRELNRGTLRGHRLLARNVSIVKVGVYARPQSPPRQRAIGVGSVIKWEISPDDAPIGTLRRQQTTTTADFIGGQEEEALNPTGTKNTPFTPLLICTSTILSNHFPVFHPRSHPSTV